MDLVCEELICKAKLLFWSVYMLMEQLVSGDLRYYRILDTNKLYDESCSRLINSRV